MRVGRTGGGRSVGEVDAQADEAETDGSTSVADASATMYAGMAKHQRILDLGLPVGHDESRPVRRTTGLCQALVS